MSADPFSVGQESPAVRCHIEDEGRTVFVMTEGRSDVGQSCH